ncbi:hypothetical protein [Limnobacter litoralis]|uniref:Uncharacterized protein n=1 Tax=Limnobacter litoralis TaxID=481366 RepID=A0ABQ5YRL4_9BURK|nr:hypothetical protein [Limnobacter litoralis]GLR26536.1 hypothetical protein GCM10007875_16260 [Limnobacter litoralis]
MRTPEQTAKIFELVHGGRTSEALRLMEQTSHLRVHPIESRTQVVSLVKQLQVDSGFEYRRSEDTDVRETWKRFGWLPRLTIARRELLA